MSFVSQLHKTLDASLGNGVIVGVSVGKVGDIGTWRVDFADGTSYSYASEPNDDRDRTVRGILGAFAYDETTDGIKKK